MRRKRMIRDYCIIHAACGLAVLLTVVYMFLQDKGFVYRMSCPFLTLTGLYCPGCGGTRALIALLHGNIMKSIRLNPATLLGGMIILYYEIGALRTILKNDGKCYYNKKGIPLYIYLAIVLIFAVARDIMLVGFGIDWL